MEIEEIIYSPIETKKEEKPKSNDTHDWNTGAQQCMKCGMDLLDYLAYGLPCKS
jgi:hypothetical protein